MLIRKAEMHELSRIMQIYAKARDFMAATGNPRQWGATNWPPQHLIRQDILSGSCRVCTQDDAIFAVFFFSPSYDDSTYHHIEDGDWSQHGPYGVVHRIAADGPRGVGTFCLRWAIEQAVYLRIDTHVDNLVMQRLLEKLGFKRCGIIHVEEDNDPRIAFDIRHN